MRKGYSSKREKYLTALMAVLLVALAILFVQAVMDEKVILEYSNEYVAMAELPSQLSFTYYEEEEWK